MPAVVTINPIPTQTPHTPFIISGTYRYPSPTPHASALSFFDDMGTTKGAFSLTLNLAGSTTWWQGHAGLPVGWHIVRVKCNTSGIVVSSNWFYVGLLISRGSTLTIPSFTGVAPSIE